MSEQEQPSQQPACYATSVTAEEFGQVDLEHPIAASKAFAPHDLVTFYREAATTAQESGNVAAHLTYSLLQGLLEMNFKPSDKAEPFGPFYVFHDRRSMMLSDIPVELAGSLAGAAPSIMHPVLRARIADIAWLVNRKLGAAAAIAVEAYCESVEKLRAGQLEREDNDGDLTDHDVIERLRRACQIATLTKGKNPLPSRITQLVSSSRSDAFTREYLHGFLESADLDLDFAVSEPAEIAKEAEILAAKVGPSKDGHRGLEMLELSARGYRDAGDADNENRLTILAAEWCVKCAETHSAVPMIDAHWLTRAIGIYGRVRSEKTRRNELRKQLIDVQARTLDDLVPIGHSIKISDIVEKVQDRISGLPLANALGAFVLASKSPDPKHLVAEARAQMKKSPLASLFSTQILDREGKVKVNSPGMVGNDANQELALRHQILQHEDIRRNLLVRSTLDPARAIINAEHGITAEKLLPLLQASPFVPPGYEFVFAQGFARWFGGDPISAASILVPQLENSLRYILKNAGEDVSTMKNDGTQEDRSIQALFDQMRAEIVRVMGEEVPYEIENLFLLRAGPGVRHGIAHGQFSAGHFYSADAAYACWFILQLCILPLLPHWAEVERYLDSA